MNAEAVIDLIRNHAGDVIKPLLADHDERLAQHADAINRLVGAVHRLNGAPVIGIDTETEPTPADMIAELTNIIARHASHCSRDDWLQAAEMLANAYFE
ncbi:MAG: hypothetical protein GXZ05_12840 [Gammaproteobacteria bacterium]|nr:hypothetical protein [Gammaproteobacteria bacterium]